MPAKIEQYSAFPSGVLRWCTRELKIEPIQSFCENLARTHGKDIVQAVGIRAEESARRAEMAEFEHDSTRDCYVWRPLLHWTTAEILAIHHENNIPINPLYKQGFDRVGCFPCIFANKEEIALLNRTEPNRLDELERLEIHVSAQRLAKGKKGNATFFKKPMREMREWSQTERGGKQMTMFQETNGGCFRWGFCEPPKKEV
jgi:3'-phosphoadenosine 5'-phosphosulfate sulfotransferase (PAPS reductase)/FAD synthetase